jgi:hypothetical protein
MINAVSNNCVLCVFLFFSGPCLGVHGGEDVVYGCLEDDLLDHVSSTRCMAFKRRGASRVASSTSPGVTVQAMVRWVMQQTNLWRR